MAICLNLATLNREFLSKWLLVVPLLFTQVLLDNAKWTSWINYDEEESPIWPSSDTEPQLKLVIHSIISRGLYSVLVGERPPRIKPHGPFRSNMGFVFKVWPSTLIYSTIKGVLGVVWRSRCRKGISVEEGRNSLVTWSPSPPRVTQGWWWKEEKDDKTEPREMV